MPNIFNINNIDINKPIYKKIFEKSIKIIENVLI